MSNSDYTNHSPDFVKDYLNKAKKAADGLSPNDTMLLSEILRVADSLDTLQYRISLDDSSSRLNLGQVFHAESSLDFHMESSPPRKSILDKLGSAILNEIYAALCQKDKRYQKESKELASNVHLLIGAIGGYVAANVGIAVAVVSAFTAVVLRLTLAMGVNAFCQVWSENRRNETEQEDSNRPR